MRRSAEPEMMDLPNQPRELLTEDLRNLRLINRYLGCHRNVLRGLAQKASLPASGAMFVDTLIACKATAQSTEANAATGGQQSAPFPDPGREPRVQSPFRLRARPGSPRSSPRRRGRTPASPRCGSPAR